MPTRSTIPLLLAFLFSLFMANCCRAQGTIQTVKTIADLVALNPSLVDTNIFVQGYNSANDGGGGIFTFHSTWSGSTNLGTTFAAQGNTNNGFWLRQYSGPINVKWFSATGNGSTDDTTAIQAAIDAVPGGGALFFPRGGYLISDTLTIPKTITISGVNQVLSEILVSSGMSASKDILHIEPLNAGDGVGITLRDFIIRAQAGTPARHGVHIDTTTAGVSQFVMERVSVRQLGGRAVFTTNPTLTDGFFCSQIQECLLYGGIKIQRGGDSVNIHGCTLTGSGIAIEADMVPGASLLSISFNNITGTGGIKLTGGDRTVILGNNLESVNVTTEGDAYVDIAGTSGRPIEQVTFQCNTLNITGGVMDALRVDYATDTIIENNGFYINDPAVTGITVTANASGTRIGFQHWWGSHTPTQRVSNLGSATVVNTVGSNRLNVYNAFSDFANNEFLSMYFAGNLAFFETGKSGSGTQRNLAIQGSGGNVGIGTNPSSTLHLGGSFAIKTVVPSAYPYAVTATDYMILASSAAANTVTLPDATTCPGRNYIVKDSSGNAAANNIGVNTTASQTIDGAPSKSITSNYGSLRMVSNGANWFTY